MGEVIPFDRAQFAVGQLVHHTLFNYRGVIVDVDSKFSGSEQWYEQVARSRPAKNKPWYHVLVHSAEHTTYVAQQNLTADSSNDPIDHPLITSFFSRFNAGRYIRHDLNH